MHMHIYIYIYIYIMYIVESVLVPQSREGRGGNKYLLLLSETEKEQQNCYFTGFQTGSGQTFFVVAEVPQYTIIMT